MSEEQKPMQFTDGPWKLRQEYGKLKIQSDKCLVLELFETNIDDTPESIERKIANLRLMAAAPELLTNIEILATGIRILLKLSDKEKVKLNFQQEDLNVLDALIAKARGKK